MMRAYAATAGSPKHDWLVANEDFRRYVLDVLRDSGPLPIGGFEDRAAVGWTSTGWTNGRNVLWDLADFPDPEEDLPKGGGRDAGSRARAARARRGPGA